MGLWHVCRDERESGEFHQLIHYDTQYVRCMSRCVDLKIIVTTLLVVLGATSCVPQSWIIPSCAN